MKYYVQFLEFDKHTRELREALGSDGVFILDGRNNLLTMRCDATMRMHRLRKVRSFCGWKIMKGERFDEGVELAKWIRSGYDQG